MSPTPRRRAQRVAAAAVALFLLAVLGGATGWWIKQQRQEQRDQALSLVEQYAAACANPGQRDDLADLGLSCRAIEDAAKESRKTDSCVSRETSSAEVDPGSSSCPAAACSRSASAAVSPRPPHAPHSRAGSGRRARGSPPASHPAATQSPAALASLRVPITSRTFPGTYGRPR